MKPADLQRAIAADPEATRRIYAYLRRLGVAHSGHISGATLAAVCGVESRTWRRWVGGDVAIPPACWRLLHEVAWPGASTNDETPAQ